MSRAFIALSKFGDIFTAIPIIHHCWKTTGKKPVVITSDRYASAFEGCSYIKKLVISKHKWGDLHGAIKLAKSMYDDVEVLQCHGDNFKFQQTKPSFQHEVYDRVGLLREWGKLPLVIDRRDGRREQILRDRFVAPNEPYILVGDTSESSQFRQIEELKMLVQSKFGATHKIILLSTVRADKIYDLIGLYDHATALITTETVHTHLSRASHVRTFVLSADGWRGSAFRKEFGFYMKYAEWDRRKNEFMDSVDNFVHKKSEPKISTFKTSMPYGYNLSSLMFEGRPIYVYRYHIGNWKTRLMICDSDKQFSLVADESISQFAVEDCRLFEFDGKLHGVYTVAGEANGFWKCYQAYGEITHENDVWRIGHIRIKYADNDFTGTNKNWVPFVNNGEIHFIFGVRGENQAVLRVENDRVLATYNSPAPRWPHGEIRGGVIILRGDTLLRFFHSRAVYPDKSFRYFVGCCTMEAKPPFRTLRICKEPILAGDEDYTPNCKHWKANVVFGLGAIERGDKILLSFGHNDCASKIAELSESDLNL